MVSEFETRVAAEMNVRNCVAMCNGTIALELSATALALRGDVIVPSFTFIATVHALWRVGLRPVFCDVDPDTHTLDPEKVEAAITPETSAIMGVALWGDYSGERALREIADRHEIALIYDSAHAFGCARELGGRKQLCDLEVVSFHATKCIQAMEGGALLTDDDDLAERLRLMVNFGFSGEDNVIHLGTNAKMNEVEAAMGLTSLDALDQIFGRNRDNLLAYAEGLENVPGLRILTPDPGTKHNFQYVVAELDSAKAGLTRDELVAALRLENVLARRYFHPGCHRMEPYRDLFPDAGQSLPATEALAERVFILPTGLDVTPDEARLIAEKIATMVRLSASVREALSDCDDPRLPGFLYRFLSPLEGV